MNPIDINGRKTVSALKKDFRTQTGGTLRVKDGFRKADESATLASIRTGNGKNGTLEISPEMTIGIFKSKMLSEFGLKVEVGTPDNWISVPDGITLGQLSGLPKNARKKSLERPDDYEKFKGLPIVVIKLEEIDPSSLAENTEDIAEAVLERFNNTSGVGIGVISGKCPMESGDLDDVIRALADETDGDVDEVYVTQDYEILNYNTDSHKKWDDFYLGAVGAAMSANWGGPGFYNPFDEMLVRLIFPTRKIFDLYVVGNRWEDEVSLDYYISQAKKKDKAKYKSLLSLKDIKFSGK